MKTFLGVVLSMVRVAIVTLILVVVIIGSLSAIPFGGKPMTHRLLPLQPPGGPSHSLVRFREAETRGPVDIVFLGSSHSYRGFDPRIFATRGYSSQNLGSTSQTPINTLALQERYLDRLRPKVVIYEIYQTALSIDGMESFYDLLSNTPIDSPTVEMTWNVRQPQAWTALLATGFRNLRTPFSSYVQNGKEGRDDHYVGDGFVQCTAQFPKDRLTALRTNTAQFHFPLNARQFELLGQCIDSVRRHGAIFVACSYPIPAETRKALVDYKKHQEAIASFLAEKGAPFRDFNLDMTLDTATDYYDEVHLNQAGVERFNAALLEWLDQKKLLPVPSTGTAPSTQP